ncbi:MAG: restriction endonuclease [Desulfocapsaceae bacterium]|nr:restriction endonuclease [Desulfocapsaceae bacterium]
MNETEKRIGHFVDNGDGTVTDTRTCLMWRRCAQGQTWDGKTCKGEARTYTWREAHNHHSHTFAGHRGWRLPNIDELKTLIDKSQGDPSIDSKAFPETPRLRFWSSSSEDLGLYDTPIIQALGFYVVNEDSDDHVRTNKNDSLSVRLVRDGQHRFSIAKDTSTKYSFTVTHDKQGFTAEIPEFPGISFRTSTQAEAMAKAEYLATIVGIVYELCVEAEKLTKPFAHIDFATYPEFKHTEGSFYTNERQGKHTCPCFSKEKFDNYLNKIFKETDKVIKNGKSILALKILAHVFENQRDYLILGDATCKRYVRQFVGLFMEAFIQLESYDVLVKYYEKDPALSLNLEFLQHVVGHYLTIKDADNASVALEKLRAIEPNHPFVVQGLKKIKTISMIKRLGESNIDMQNIDSLSGHDFESLLTQQFIKLGFITQGTPASRDFGADIIVDTDDGTRFVIQCKRFKNKVNLKAVQEVVGAMPHYNGDIGIVITSNGFLPSATILAESNGIELWGNMELMNFLSDDLSFSQMAEWKK